MKLPTYAYDLIEHLDETYPEIVYDPRMDREEFLLRSGERRLVLQLKRLREAEQERERTGG